MMDAPQSLDAPQGIPKKKLPLTVPISPACLKKKDTVSALW
jgi:hypothetical protein